MKTFAEGLLTATVFCGVIGCAIMGPGQFFDWLGAVVRQLI